MKNVVATDAPQHVVVKTEISMRDSVSNRDNFSSLDLRHRRANRLGHLVRSLADQLDIPLRRVVVEPARDEAILIESVCIEHHALPTRTTQARSRRTGFAIAA